MPRASGRLHAIFAIYTNQREYFFCYTRFGRVIFFVQTILKKKFTLFEGTSHFDVNRRW